MNTYFEFGLIMSNTILRPAFIFSFHKIFSLRMFYFSKSLSDQSTGIEKYILKLASFIYSKNITDLNYNNKAFF